MKKKDKLSSINTQESPLAERLLAKLATYKSQWIRFGISVVFLSILYVGIAQYQKVQDAKCKSTYLDASTEDKKKAFVQEFATSPLGGKVALELGDSLYTQEQYDEALKYYDIASQSLIRTSLRGRLYLGKAMCFLRLQKIEQAKQMLTRLLQDKDIIGQTRAEAALKGVLLAIKQEDPEGMQTYREELERLPYSDLAKERLRLIEAMIQ